ncbi:MAG: guanylate kinase [Kiritimatiellia bacterium]
MNIEPIPHPVLLLVSAPSGTGKTTLCHRLMQDEPELRYSVSSTTRAPRVGETDGVDYTFLSRDEFLLRAGDGKFLEFAEVHGNLYGTEIGMVERTFLAGYSVLLDVDVQGARLIREALDRESMNPKLRQCFHDVFISPPSLDALRYRLEKRGKDSQEVIEKRLRNAKAEMLDAAHYEYQVINDDLDSAFAQLTAIHTACRLRTVRLQAGRNGRL